MLATFIISTSIAWIAVCGIQLIRVQMMSNVLKAEIKAISNRRQAILTNGGSWNDVSDVSYPDISQCYKNLKWYKPWERPSTLLVFEKEY